MAMPVPIWNAPVERLAIQPDVIKKKAMRVLKCLKEREVF
jgi:hypothetical protein